MLGYVRGRHGAPRSRVVVPQEDIDLVRSARAGWTLRIAADPRRSPSRATILREVPDVNARLPSPALGTRGGGQLVMDPRDTKHDRR